ncbi:MAG TPA: bifunctional nitrate reductase/sulfite reductase flavoprotein subunit alpha [Mycobacterium sp.]
MIGHVGVDHAETVRAQCSYCGVGCGVTIEATGSAAPKITGDKAHPVNAGRLCTKGATHGELLRAQGRLETALIRRTREDPLKPVDVDTAVAEAARRLREAVDEHGPDAVALYVSGQLTLEAQYLANKLAKGFLRTMHIESNSRLCMASAASGYKQSLGSDGPPGSYDDFDTADLFFVTGSNMADCHPILFLRMADRLKAGAKLIVVDPRRTATAERADLFLQIKPGTDLALLNGILHLLAENDDIDHTFIQRHTEGWDAMLTFLDDYPPSRVARLTGVPESDIRAAAHLIAAAGNWMSCWTMGLNQSTHGTWNTNAICNLHLATGAICRSGSGPMSLTGQPNAMGGRDMGYMGAGLPGQRSVASAADRAFVEKAWGIKPGSIRSEVGMGTIEMFSKMAAGDIKACWIICTNPVASMANRKTVITGLESADLVITQDVYSDTATNSYADIVLPATLWAESEGVMVNSERTLTLNQRALQPPAQARPDWQLIAEVACALGFGDHFTYESSEQVFDEIRGFANDATGYDIRGISYAGLRRTPMQWPCPPNGNARNPIRYLGVDGPRFATPSGKAVFFARPHMDPDEMPDDDFPWVLNTGRLPHHWHTLTKTGKIATLAKLNPAPFVEVNPIDAAALGLTPAHKAEIDSRRGRAVLPVAISDRVQPGNCFAPFHWNDEHGEYLTINAVTNDAVDETSLQPELKACAVRLRAVPPEPVTTQSVPQPHSGSIVGEIASALAIGAATVPILTDDERMYLGGFLAGLDLRPVEGIPVLPADAPLGDATRLWVNGLLAGAYSSKRGTVSASVEGDDVPVVVLWASQTGNAEQMARRCSDGLRGRGISHSLRAMDGFALEELCTVRTALMVTSTFGTGEPPDNGAAFWTRLAAGDAPALTDLRYAVLALGDSSYDDFCGHGRALDERFVELGATRLLERVECEPGDDELAEQWLDEVLALVDAPVLLPARGVTVVPDESPSVPSVMPVPSEVPTFTKANPLHAPLVTNVLLSGPGSEKEVRHLGFGLDSPTLTYEPGDALGVVPQNSVAVVSDWLDATGLDGTQPVDGRNSFATLLRTTYDITTVTPALLRFVADHNRDPLLAKLLRRGNKTELAKWLWNRQAVDVLRAFPVQADRFEWCEVLRPLQPRTYSIASSPLSSPSEIQLTISVLRYESEYGAERGGVCSTFLAGRNCSQATPIFLRRSFHFRLPTDPAAPIIMIGPGTGIAPFRAFLQHRRELGCRGRNWLFFGDQHVDSNFYYRNELERMFADGFLTRLDLAFSRDQRERLYVQHRMHEHGAELWRWINDGAHLYVCGDASRMAKDVDAALTQILATHGKLDDEAAAGFKEVLIAENRYLRDVY